MSPSLRIRVLPHGQGLPLPAYQSAGAAGLDLCAAEGLLLQPGQRAAVPTGLAIAIPAGFEGQVRARSGLALKHGLGVANAPGTIDADYRGELKVILINLGHDNVAIERGQRIAQLVVAPVVQVAINVVDELDDTARGRGGFGSTGA